MSSKIKTILTWVLVALPSLMLIMSGIMKLMGGQQVVEGLTKAGFGSYITVLGLVELLSTALFIYPKTRKIGFALLCSYLGGAGATELATGQPPVGFALIAILWIAMYVDNKTNFVQA